MKRAFLTIVAMCVAGVALAQGPDIQKYVTLLNNGGADQVKADLPGLLTSYPNNPGVLYLQARLTGDGPEAVRMYQSIVDNFPKTEYAEDALFRVYQFYYALGLYRTAELKLNQLKQEYPNSKLLLTIGTAPAKGLTDDAGAQAPPVTESKPTTPPAKEVPVTAPVTPPVTAPVSAPVKTSSDAPAVAPSTTKTGVSFALQAGAFSTRANAEKEKKYFEGLGYTVEIVSKTRDEKPPFLVFVGSYPSYDAAKAKAEELKKNYGKNSFPVSR